MRDMHVKHARLTAFLSTAMVLVALAAPAAVAAHAVLESTSPEAGSTVEVSPAEVSATFDDGLVASKSSIEVIAPDDSTVATGGVAADDPKTLVVVVPSLAPGTYRVRWAAATDDGHLERGRFEFTVAEAPSPEPTPEATVAPTASVSPSPAPVTTSPSTATPSASPTPGDSGGGSESIGQILVIAAAGIGLGLGFGWWRSRRAA